MRYFADVRTYILCCPGCVRWHSNTGLSRVATQCGHGRQFVRLSERQTAGSTTSSRTFTTTADETAAHFSARSLKREKSARARPRRPLLLQNRKSLSLFRLSIAGARGDDGLGAFSISTATSVSCGITACRQLNVLSSGATNTMSTFFCICNLRVFASLNVSVEWEPITESQRPWRYLQLGVCSTFPHG